MPIEVAAHIKPTNEIKQIPIILSNPHKILYPEDNISKEDVFHYYEKVCDWMLPYIINRPLTVMRCPKNYGECFYQKHFNKSSSKSITPISIEDKKDNHIEHYLSVSDRAGLLGLVQMGVLEIHPWGSTARNLDKPDIVIFDLDPSPDLSWEHVVKASFIVKDFLEQLNLVSFVKTTGGKGLHVVIPIKPQNEWDKIKEFTFGFVKTLEKIYPKVFVSNMAKNKRNGKIFLDYLRNQWDAIAIGPYSTRARPHAPVATPIHWEELTYDIKDTHFTIFTLPKRLQNIEEDPWEKFWEIAKIQSFNLEKFK